MKKFIGNKDFYRLVAVLALPLLLQNAVSTFVNLLDNLMVGRIGTESMSGVSIVNQLLFVYNLCLFGGSGGAGIFGAQFFGAGDIEGVRNTFRIKWMILLSILSVAFVAFLGFSRPLIRFSAVLFPHPEGPRSPTSSPSGISKSKSFTAMTSWAFFPLPGNVFVR